MYSRLVFPACVQSSSKLTRFITGFVSYSLKTAPRSTRAGPSRKSSRTLCRARTPTAMKTMPTWMLHFSYLLRSLQTPTLLPTPPRKLLETARHSGYGLHLDLYKFYITRHSHFRLSSTKAVVALKTLYCSTIIIY